MPNVAIVDAYSSGNLFAPELKKRGYRVLHIQSLKQIPDGYLASFHQQDFEQNLVCDDSESASIEKLVQTLKQFNVICILPGSEPGVMLSDILSERLNLKTNGTKLSLARRHKFEMLEQVGRAGLSVPKQSLQTSLLGTLAWIETESSFPVVLKPVNSAGTDGVAICQNRMEVGTACEAILGKTNRLAQINEAVLVQEYLCGTEYAVNSVSLAGEHFISSVWKYIKTPILRTEISFYDRDVLISPLDPIFEHLAKYSKDVLKVLGIKYGPAHVEIMMTGLGPKLIELGARMSGATMPDLDLKTAGFGQMDLSLDAYLDPVAFSEKTSRPRRLCQVSELVTIRNETSGIITGSPGLDEIFKLKSYFSSRIKFKVGDHLPPTRNVFTSPGFLILSHEDNSQLAADALRIKELEKTGLFTVQ